MKEKIKPEKANNNLKEKEKKDSFSIVDELGDPKMGYDYDAEDYYTYENPDKKNEK